MKFTNPAAVLTDVNKNVTVDDGCTILHATEDGDWGNIDDQVNDADKMLDVCVYVMCAPMSLCNCKFDPIIISDSAPVTIKVALPTQRTKKTWQLDTFLLVDSDFVKFITEQKDFFPAGK